MNPYDQLVGSLLEKEPVWLNGTKWTLRDLLDCELDETAHQHEYRRTLDELTAFFLAAQNTTEEFYLAGIDYLVTLAERHIAEEDVLDWLEAKNANLARDAMLEDRRDRMDIDDKYYPPEAA